MGLKIQECIPVQCVPPAHLPGGERGREACVAGRHAWQGHAWQGHAWQGACVAGGLGVCMAGVMHGRRACLAWGSCVSGGHAWPCTRPCGQTDACENITLPQTSFAGGNWKSLKGKLMEETTGIHKLWSAPLKDFHVPFCKSSKAVKWE